EALALAGDAVRARAERMELAGDERLCAALHVCAVREVFEEAGILLSPEPVADGGRLAAARARVLGGAPFAGELAALAARPALADLAYVARFVTPAGLPRRFDTRFFAVRAPDGQEAAVHAGEADAGDWFAPGELLARAAGGEATVMPPTRVMLAELTRHADVASALADLGSREVCGILFTLAMARQPMPDHLPTVAEVEAMGARA
ncbi:MAG TPA: hypothetical protein VFO60_09620, partial [Candidatus Dormibacteraeota bacterium]|nr:hypothetical protein [Candidatus Dormibacteraeota bacterium]